MASRKNNEDQWSSSSDEEDDDDDEEEIDSGDEFTFYSICSNPSTSTSLTFNSLSSALQHDVSTYQFDFLQYISSSLTTSDYDGNDEFFENTIKLINKCRQFVKDKENEDMAAVELGKQLNEFLQNQPANNEEDDMIYYKPVLEDDAMLMCIDELQELRSKNAKPTQAQDNVLQEDGKMDRMEGEDSETINKLQSQISLLEDQLSRAKACIASLAKDDDDEPQKKKPDNDSYYFTSYSNTSIHETMLRDTVRTAAYEDAILSNSESLFRGKTVLDIGCGTGVLSLFCAKAGAKKVIAIDNSDIINQAKEIVKLNGYDHVISCVRGKMETLLTENGLPLSNGETVDIIVSEWMGYALFFETMLPSVMTARNAIMTPDSGTMFPNVSKIYLEGGNDSERLNYWDNVHSLNMTPMKERMVNELTQEADVDVVDDKNIVTNRALLIEHNLNTCKDEDLDFEAPFELHLRNGEKKSADSDDDTAMEIHQLVVSFDIDFSVPGSNVVSFSTGCQSTPTHWKQAVLWFDTLSNCPALRSGEVMKGTFRMKRNAENHRSIDMAVMWEIGSIKDGVWNTSMNGRLKRSLIA